MKVIRDLKYAII